MDKFVTEQLSEEEFASLQRNDRVVFRRVFQQYIGLIQYVVRRCGADAAMSDDIVQETFLRLLLRAKEIKQPSALKAWLATTARNLTLDERRRRKNLVTADNDNADNPDTTLESLQHELDVALVGELIQAVSQECGDSTFSDFYLHGQSAKEIAAAKGEAISTVTTRLSRLRNRFQERFRLHLQALRNGLP